MSEIGFDITPKSTLTEGERAALRQHYLTYVRAERDEGRQLRADLGEIYATIDKLADGLDMADLISRMGESSHIVIFATESSVLALREFQQAMLSEGKVVRLVSENSTEVNGIRALGPSDLLIVVTTSNGFARRQRELIGRSGAQKVVQETKEPAVTVPALPGRTCLEVVVRFADGSSSDPVTACTDTP